MRRAVALAIRGYRRWLSGRGPLRRVRCTFAATESCSAYGLRAVEELSTSLPDAMRLVRARIRACRCTSVYRFPAGIGWETDHDQSPAELVSALTARGERADTIAQVLAARTLVARWRGDRASFAEAIQLQKPAKHPIPVRAGDVAIAHHRRAMRRGLAIAMISLVACWVTMLAVVPLAFALVAAHTSHEAARRLETQRIAATFLRPAISPRLDERSATSPMMAR